jgi:hypothetical protein
VTPEIDLTPEQLEAVLAHFAIGHRLDYGILTGMDMATVGRDGVSVARMALEGDRVRGVALACYRAAHGVAGPFREAAAQLAKLTMQEPNPGGCKTCRGTGWIPARSPACATVAALAITSRIFRGLALPEKSILESTVLNAVNQAATGVLNLA